MAGQNWELAPPFLLQASFGRWLAHAGPHANPKAVRRALQAGTDEANAAILEAGMQLTMLMNELADERRKEPRTTSRPRS